MKDFKEMESIELKDFGIRVNPYLTYAQVQAIANSVYTLKSWAEREQNLAWSATSAATVSLSGTALAVDDGASCEEDPIYGTMTQEIFGAKWQDDVKAIAVSNADIELSSTVTSETLQVYAVFGGAVASRLMDNNNFNFAVESGSSATVAETGIVSKGSGTGNTVISVTLKNASGVATDIVGYANVTVS